jgi:hypothetical protein
MVEKTQTGVLQRKSQNIKDNPSRCVLWKGQSDKEDHIFVHSSLVMQNVGKFIRFMLGSKLVYFCRSYNIFDVGMLFPMSEML